MKGDPFRMCVTSQLGEKGATVTQMHQKLIRGGKKEKEEKEEKKNLQGFSFPQHAIIYLRMKHKLPGTLVTMATVKSIAELFWHPSPH